MQCISKSKRCNQISIVQCPYITPDRIVVTTVLLCVYGKLPKLLCCPLVSCQACQAIVLRKIKWFKCRTFRITRVKNVCWTAGNEQSIGLPVNHFVVVVVLVNEYWKNAGTIFFLKIKFFYKNMSLSQVDKWGMGGGIPFGKASSKIITPWTIEIWVHSWERP